MSRYSVVNLILHLVAVKVSGSIVHEQTGIITPNKSLRSPMETFARLVKQNISRFKIHLVGIAVEILNDYRPRLGIVRAIHVKNAANNMRTRSVNMHQQIAIVPIRPNTIRNAPHQVNTTPPFEHGFHLLQNIMVLPTIGNHNRSRVILPSNNINKMFFSSPRFQNLSFGGDALSRFAILGATLRLFDACHFQIFMQSFLKTSSEVFGCTGQSPSVFGVVGGDHGGGYESHPSVVAIVAVFYSTDLFKSFIQYPVPSGCVGNHFL
mmetsp:Transcript_1475/g.2524  ORF Transcript_1475/g.2524 Transcript_1475/m.2524 type:complete len:265 (-) Transcript_1475:91-885(-)